MGRVLRSGFTERRMSPAKGRDCGEDSSGDDLTVGIERV